MVTIREMNPIETAYFMIRKIMGNLQVVEKVVNIKTEKGRLGQKP